jgi:hypothetical protein
MAFLAGLILSAPAWAQATCDATAQSDAASYEKATARVRSLAEFKAWPGNAQAIFGTQADKQSLIRRKCYWTVTVSGNDGLRQSFWQKFLVPVGSGRVLAVEPNGKLRALRK